MKVRLFCFVVLAFVSLIGSYRAIGQCGGGCDFGCVDGEDWAGLSFDDFDSGNALNCCSSGTLWEDDNDLIDSYTWDVWSVGVPDCGSSLGPGSMGVGAVLVKSNSGSRQVICYAGV